MDYRKMKPDEQIRYYRKRLEDLKPPRSYHDRFLIEVFEQLIEEARSTLSKE